MTGKERVRLAMENKKADRCPFFCQFSLGHYMLNTHFSPLEIWYSSEAFSEALLLLARRYGADGVLVNLPGRPTDWQDHIAHCEENSDETILYWDDGSYSRCPKNDNAHHFSSVRIPSIEETDPADFFYIEPHNITGIKYPFYYDFMQGGVQHDESFFPDYLMRAIRSTVAAAGSDFHVSSEIFSPFTQLMEFFGYAEALVALVDNPVKCERILENLAYGASKLALLQTQQGVDAVLVSSAFAGGGFISAEYYKRFVLPYEHYVVNAIHSQSEAFVYVHTCGSIGDRIGLMVETGYDGIDTLDPPPLGNTDILNVKQEWGDRIFLKGNIDPVNLIRYSTPDAVYEKASELIRTVGKGGGYILSSACSVPPQTPPENIRALYRASTDHPY